MAGLSDQAIALFRQGVAALEAEDFPSAERIFGALAASHPRSHEVWNALSVAALRAGQADVAVERARRALEFDRRNPLYMNSLGVAYGEQLDFGAAEEQFRRALKVKPNYAEAVFNLGKVLHKQRRSREALQTMERAYALNADCPGLPANLAQLYLLHGQPEQARRVIAAMRGGIPRALAPLYAQCITQLEGFESALAWLRNEMRARPDWQALQFTLSGLLLACAHWREGWIAYGARPGLPADRRGYYAGEFPPRLEGRTVLLHHEQGLGDILFFLRFVPLLQARGARVIALCPEALLPLLAEAADEVRAVEDRPADFTLWLADLPVALQSTDTPPPVRVKPPDAVITAMAERLSKLGPPPYLGLTWRAGTDTDRVQEFRQSYWTLSKEIEPQPLGQALRGWRGTLVSVQRNPLDGEAAALSNAAGVAVHDFSAANSNLVEMTALLSCLDDYVAVSNTNVHLFAGLGKKGRVLVPQPPEWRWMHEGDASPWFPGFALYRQPVSRDWSAALSRLRRDLVG